MNKVWNMVQNSKGKNNKTNVHHLKDGHDTLTSEQDISNKLGQTFPKNSSTQNYHSEFKKSKKQKEQTKLNFKSKKLEEYNPFSLDELRKSLDKAHDTACGPNDIHFQLLKHLPESALQTLLELMNDIWETGDLPSIWKLANVIHIPKPGKDHSEPSKYRPISITSCVCKAMERIQWRSVLFVEETGGLGENHRPVAIYKYSAYIYISCEIIGL
jgi:potassium voltage-gated channel Eag-related subfamily H protein 8